MTWVYIAIAAYLINAVAFIVDKYLLHSPIPKPFVYTFWVSLLSISAVVLIPFGVYIPNLSTLFLSLLSGASFFCGLIFLYTAIKASDITVASSKVGAATAVFTYIFSYFFIHDGVLDQKHLVALSLMVVGMLVLSRFKWKIISLATISGLFSGLSFTLLKLSFEYSDLVNGIFWTRMGFVLAALVSLLFVFVRKDVKHSFKTSSKSSKAVFVLNKIIAGCGFILLYYSIFKGNPSIINGMAGLQYVFVFLIAFAAKDLIPGIKESLDKKSILIKISGLIFIFDGFLLLFTSI